ncbi:YjbQ family protein [bacterium]|nr:YjbQ family protein [bacterium]
MNRISVSTSSRNEMIDITRKVQDVVSQAGINEGICVVYVPHTTAGVTINEGADPSVQTDILSWLTKLVPSHQDPQTNFHHSEGNSDSHIKSTIVGSSVNLIVSSGKLSLGTWQSIFFCEFDGPRTRRVYVEILGNRE